MEPILSVFVSLGNDGVEACRMDFLCATTLLDIIELPSLVVNDYFSSANSPTGKLGPYKSLDPSRVVLPSQGSAGTVDMLGTLPPAVRRKYESTLFLLKSEQKIATLKNDRATARYFKRALLIALKEAPRYKQGCIQR